MSPFGLRCLAMPSTLRRIFKISIPPDAKYDLDRFLERLNSAIHAYGSVIRIEGNTIYIEVYGGKTMIKDTWTRIKKVLREYTPPPKGGFKLVRIYRDVGIALPPDVLAAVIEASGYRTEYDRENLYTDASYEEVLLAAKAIRGALEEMRGLNATRTAKKLLATLSAIWGAPVASVIDVLIEKGYARLSDSGKIELLRPWKEALSELKGERAR